MGLTAAGGKGGSVKVDILCGCSPSTTLPLAPYA